LAASLPTIRRTRVAEKVEVLDFLRGIASLGVCVGHIAFVARLAHADVIFKYGRLGVPVFFVISGFIIPYSLHAYQYEIRNYFTFILKRIVRLDPPYFATILLIIAMQYAAHVIPRHGAPFSISWVQVLLHLGYLNAFVGYPWLNPVFWTLAVEFQFYLLIGLIYPLLFSRNAATRFALILVLILLSKLMPNPWYVVGHLCQFLLGIVACQYRIGLIGKRQCTFFVALAAVFAVIGPGLGIDWTVSGLFAVVLILNFRLKSSVATFFGNISYSLYLLHAPVAFMAQSVLARLIGADQNSFSGFLAFIVPLVAAIAAAYLLYLLVERPAQRWSKVFRYSRVDGEVGPVAMEVIVVREPA
jgi:peptidoglycan/LPS O-acetylase OafA/YrhL